MRYLDFNDNFLVNPGYLRTLFNEYPVLLRLLCTKTDYWVQNFSELWKRLRQDREQLQAAFHIAGDPVLLSLGWETRTIKERWQPSLHIPMEKRLSINREAMMLTTHFNFFYHGSMTEIQAAL